MKTHINNEEVKGKLLEPCGDDGLSTHPKLLENLIQVWEDLTIFAVAMDRLFHQLNLNHLKCHELPSCSQLVHETFRSELFELIKHDVSVALIGLIEKDRANHHIDKEIVRNVIQILSDLGISEPKLHRVDGRYVWTGKANLNMYYYPYLT